jgi:tetratricopeptide (TPR) repeat protein
MSQALEMARQLVRQEPGYASLAIQKKCYLAAVDAHVARGAFRDAHSLLIDAEKLRNDDPAWWERLAEFRADLGDHTAAMKLLERVPGSAVRPRIMGRIADRAMREGPAGRAMLPDELRPQFDIVRQAFAEYEAGRDEPAREKLNGIGLASPFLEWKLALRGLMAWSANDIARAIENWSRLSPDRFAARLVEPLRVSVDKAYASTLPAQRLSAAIRHAETLSGGLVGGMRRLQKQLANDETIPEALETARAIVPEMKRVAEDLVPRLGNLVYWTLVVSGQPEDMSRYTKIFGSPPDDPQFFRLQAMIMESMSRLDKAHEFWSKYENWIARTPDRWPGELGKRARALVLERMGRLARDWLADEGDDEDFRDFLSFFERNSRGPSQRRPLKPSAAECFRTASELAPDWIKPAMELLREYSDDPVKAFPAIAAIVERFPNDLAVLEAAADFYERIGDTAKAHECMRRALAANPLDRGLRLQASALAINEARRRAIGGEFDSALAALREAAGLSSPTSPAVLALSAALELCRKNVPEFERHRDALLAIPDGRLAGTYRLFVEATRLKLKKKDLTPYQTAFTDGLDGPVQAMELLSLVDAVAQYQQEPTKYRGLQTHAKKILDRVMSSAHDESEFELLSHADQLHSYNLFKPLQTLADIGTARFPDNAYFHFFNAESMLSRRRADYVNANIGNAYRRAKKLMRNAKDNRYERLQELLNRRIEQTPDLERILDDRFGYY